MSASTDSRTRTVVILAWTLPVGIALSALLPLTGRAGLVFGALGGTLVFLLIWFVWSTSLAAIATALSRAGRRLGSLWTAIQALLLLALVIGDLPPLLVAVPPVERLAAGSSFLVVPTVAIVLCAAQGLVLFFRA